MLVKFKNFAITVLLLIFIMMAFLNQKGIFAQPTSWSDEIRLTYNSNSSVYPIIGVWGNYIHVFWSEKAPGPISDYDIFYRRSIDGGKSWENTKKLIDTDKSLGGLSMDLNQSNIHLVWYDGRSGFNYIYYTKSNDSGENWETEKIISSPSSGGYDPDITVNGNNIHVVYWHNYKLFYMNSTDNGDNWSEVQQLTSPIRDSKHPAIAINGNYVHIVWMDHYDKNGQSTAGAIFYMNSTDGGLTWSEDYNLTPMNVDSNYPDIDVNGSIIHVSYVSDRSGFLEIYYERSEDNGITWTDNLRLSNLETDFGGDSKIAHHDNDLHLVWWAEKGSERESYYLHSPNNGYNWSNISLVSPDPTNSLSPNIGLYEKNVHLVWRNDIGGIPEIYYKYYPFYPPPTNFTIDIWGTNLALNWTTPQTGLSPVDYYLIYRVTDPEAFTFSDPEIIYNSSGTGNELLTTWNDTTALLDEANNYYYVIRAVYEDGEIDTNENIVGKFVILLKAGWNLISLPLAQNDTKIPEVIKSISGKYNIVYWYDAKDGTWRSSTNDLTDINRTMGLWIHMKNACNLSVVGALPDSTDIALYEGWNLVGYPSLNARNLGDALSGITRQAVQQYDAFDTNDPWKHNSTKKPDNLNDLKGMEPGRGYWVYVTINDTWIRTRTDKDDKMVIWRVGGSEEKNPNNQPIYEPTIKNPIGMEEEDDYQIDNVPEKPIKKDDGNSFTFSIIPLLILIAFVLAEIVLLHKRKK